VWNLEVSLFFYIYIFQQSQRCAGSIPKSKLKSKISHSLIHMGFIGLVTWSGLRGLWKKGSERLKECLRVTLSKNLESVACTFWVGLYSFCLIHWSLLRFLCLPCKIWRSFVSLFFTFLWRILFSFSFNCCPTSCMCCLHCSSRQFSSGSYAGFLFCCLFLWCF